MNSLPEPLNLPEERQWKQWETQKLILTLLTNLGVGCESVGLLFTNSQTLRDFLKLTQLPWPELGIGIQPLDTYLIIKKR